jgi:hypothetical protein
MMDLYTNTGCGLSALLPGEGPPEACTTLLASVPWPESGFGSLPSSLPSTPLLAL